MPIPQQHVIAVRRGVDRLLVQIGKLQQQHRIALAAVHPSMRGSARNLLAYLAVVMHGTPAMRKAIASIGLRFPDETPAHISAALHRIRTIVAALSDLPSGSTATLISTHGWDEALEARTQNLLGTKPRGTPSHIMVTLPDEARTSRNLVKDLLRAGMTTVRINCAQNDRGVWGSMIRNVRRASGETGKPCRILMDLSGQKVRTGRMIPGPQVLHLQPRRDDLGRVILPMRIWLGPSSGKTREDYRQVIPAPPGWLSRIRKGDRIAFVDARNKKRILIAGRASAGGRYAFLHESAYIQTGTTLKHVDRQGGRHSIRVGTLQRTEVRIPLRPGDTLCIHRDPRPGEPARRDAAGRVVHYPHISCTFPDVFRCVRRGEPVVFDNGIIEGVVIKVVPNECFVRIIRTAGQTATLRADKGINFPMTKLTATGLTAKDKDDFAFAARHADLVSLSFVRTPGDVHALRRETSRMAGTQPGIIIKIETHQAVLQLPGIFLAAMCMPRIGIMMARGDLAVEYGWVHLAALEAKLLTMCRAAQVPALVATQILETMTKRAVPTRAEIVDAALASNAQCVLLNKGQHIVPTVRLLLKILRASRGCDGKQLWELFH
jgi:pyruvate kinase